MAATATYGFPYPGLSDSPHGPNQIQALAQAVEDQLELTDDEAALIKELLAGYAAPAQTGSGNLSTGGNGAVIMEVAIPDPGFSYHIIASGALGWAMVGASQPNQLLEGAITVNSLVYTTNRITAGYRHSVSLGALFTQSTLSVPEKRSDALGAQSGSKTVRLLARNSGANTMYITPDGADTALTVRIVPA